MPNGRPSSSTARPVRAALAAWATGSSGTSRSAAGRGIHDPAVGAQHLDGERACHPTGTGSAAGSR